MSTASNRIYILDTNVLVHDPDAIFAFENTTIGIPVTVLEELDELKEESTERGYSARRAIRHFDVLREKGSLRDGVIFDNGSTLQVLFVPAKSEVKSLNLPFNLDKKDNLILLTALALKDKGYDVQFISKDINARVKADVLGIAAQDYLKDDISEKYFYKGWVRIQVPAGSLQKEFPPELKEFRQTYNFINNEYALVESQHNPFNFKIFRYVGGDKFIPIEHPNFRWPLEARNPQQLMALNMLCDPSIQCATLFGQAGTGKTFLALLAGLHQVLVEDTYQKMLVSRPVVPLGKDIGYLPGTIEEKLHSWMLPIYDNMEYILHAADMRHSVEDYEYERKDKEYKEYKGKKRKKHEKQLASLDTLIHQGKVSLEAITYMRGRSIPYQYILIDEVQNLTPHEVKTLISRVGEGSKIILAGDPYQIDSAYLTFGNNGLIIASNKFKGYPIFGTIYLENSERSELSKLVSAVWQ